MADGDDVGAQRLSFLADIALKEARYLVETDARLFPVPFTADSAAALPQLPDVNERVDAFVARLSRLQDGLADKLLPALLRHVAEPVGPTIDNLMKAERFGWLSSAQDWLACRQLRNRLIHEYVNDPVLLANGLNAAHQAVPLLTAAAQRLAAEVQRRLAGPAPIAPPK